jgi:methyl-accepting chemotaxis protein
MTTQAQHAGPAAKPHPGAVGTAFVNLRRRRTYLIDPKTQFAITRQFVLVLIAASGLSVANYHVIRTVLDEASADSIDRAIAYGYCGLMLAISVSLLLLLCVFFSHRIAGPARKLAQGLDQLADRNLCLKIRLRDTDLLVELADAFNAATRDLRTAMNEVASEVRRAQMLPTGSKEQRACLLRVEKLLAGFQITTAEEQDARAAASRGVRLVAKSG